MNRSYARLEVNGKIYSVVDAPRSGSQSNWYEEAPAGEESTGKVLMAAVDYQRMITESDSTGQPAYVVFGVTDSQSEVFDEKIRKKVVVSGVTPFLTSGNVDVDYQEDRFDCVEVTLIGFEYFEERRSTSDSHYNVQVDGFTLDNLNKPNYKDSAPFVKSTSTPTSLLNVLGYVSGEPSTFSPPPVELRNLYAVGVPKSELARRAFTGLGVIADCVNKKYYNKGQHSARNSLLLAKYTTRVFEKTAYKTASQRYPVEVDVAFTQVGPSSTPGDVHLVRRALTRGESPIIPQVPVGHWLAYKGPSGVLNAAELGSVSDWFTSGAGNALDIHADYGNYKFAGIINFDVDGAVRRVLWTCNAIEVSTTICYNHSVPMKSSDPGFSRRTYSTLPSLVSRSLDGTDLILSPPGSSFPIIVLGNAAVVAGAVWRYTVRKVSVTDNGSSLTYSYPGPDLIAFNGSENPVDGSGVYGIGFETTSGGSLLRRPIRNGAVAPATVDDGGSLIFSLPNGYKVGC